MRGRALNRRSTHLRPSLPVRENRTRQPQRQTIESFLPEGHFLPWLTPSQALSKCKAIRVPMEAEDESHTWQGVAEGNPGNRLFKRSSLRDFTRRLDETPHPPRPLSCPTPPPP